METGIRCPACSAANPPDALLCGDCGKPLGEGKAPLFTPSRNPRQRQFPPEVPGQTAPDEKEQHKGTERQNEFGGAASNGNSRAAEKPWWEYGKADPAANRVSYQHLPVFRITMAIWSVLFLIYVIYSILN